MDINKLKKKFPDMVNFLGKAFLNYLLNDNNDYKQNARYVDFEFNPIQINTLIELDKIIEIALKGISYKDTLTKKNALINFSSAGVFNPYVVNNGRELPSLKSEDELFKFIYEKAINIYPGLLIKPRFNEHNPLANIPFNYSEDVKKIRNLLLEDDDFKDYFVESNLFLDFKLDENQRGLLPVDSIINELLYRSFLNCCLRIDYSLETYLKEVEIQYINLKKTINGESVTYSNFFGVYGLHIEDQDKLIVSDNFIIHNILTPENPYPEINDVICNVTNGDKKYISGAIIEIKEYTELNYDKNEKSRRIINKSKHKFDLFKKSLPFALTKTKKPITLVFEDISLPYSFNYNLRYLEHRLRRYGDTIINNDNIQLIKKWTSLFNKDTEKIDLAIERIIIAIYEREKPIDSIIDSFIAWEGLLSDQGETKFKIISSTIELLGIERKDYHYNLYNKLYDLRSAIAHGRSTKKSMNQLEKNFDIKNIGEAKNKVIEIVIRVIEKIVMNDDLISMNSSDRVNKILFNINPK